ncbi:MAG: DUF4838 domain-containing protein [Chthonomonadaceae bacterium]|nr:DUF4838 domain-containing protein [Chthonomonadaceae bacterium]
MVSGKRTQEEGRWQVCFSNEDAAKEFARNLAEEAKIGIEQRGLKEERLRFWVSPNDGRTGCDCEACTKLRDTEGATSSMVTLFAKRVADISLGGTLKTISVPARCPAPRRPHL